MEKPLTGFSPNKNCKFGVTSRCKKCSAENAAKRRVRKPRRPAMPASERRVRARMAEAAYRDRDIEAYRARRAAAARARRQNSIREILKNRIGPQLCRYLTVDDLRRHVEAHFLPGMSWANRSKWHIDHVRPLASFVFSGPQDPQVREAWALSNLRPLWAVDNIRKGDRWIQRAA
jgi:hypothetical protein